ncbi:MAG: inositol monophosphatase family protein [Aestuariivirga sp.]
MSEITSLTAFALTLAEVSGQAILPHFRSTLKVDNKRAADWDPVTEGDREAERVIREAIEKAYPTHGIIGEEYGEKKGSSAYTWILDPIDGTRSFVIGMPTWTTLIALYKDGKPLLGLMNQPYVGEVFYGSPEGAFVQRGSDKRRLKCAAPKPLAQALAGTTSPHSYQPESHIENLRKKTRLLRYGGDAYFFALVAAGHLDIALDAGVQIYDVAALIPIVTAAGGVVGCWDDGDATKGGNVMMASCQELFDEAKRALVG